MIKKILFVQLALLLVYGCATVPLTGRQQLSIISSAEISNMAAQQYQEVLKESKLSSNAEQTAMVKRVGARIQHAVEQYMTKAGLSAQLQDFHWEFNLIEDDKMVNAWCMPGGKVAFYTGIMPICQDETGVAVVMGHEVAHAIANHGGERMSQAMVENGLVQSLGAALGQNPTLTQQIFLQAVGVGADIGMLKFSRDQESEADHIGLIFIAMAGYDPAAAPKFWERMISMSNSPNPPEFLSTHPSDDRRIKQLNAWLPEAKKYAKANGKVTAKN